MLMFPFILQNLNTGRPQEFAWQARELIEAENQWQNGKEEPIAYQMATLEQLQNQPSTIDKNAGSRSAALSFVPICCKTLACVR